MTSYDNVDNHWMNIVEDGAEEGVEEKREIHGEELTEV